MRIMLIIMMSVLLFACSNMGENKANIGAVGGGIVGAAACSGVGDGIGKVGVMIGCGIVGALIGSHIGSYLDEEDKRKVSTVLEYGQDNEKVSWSNPQTGCDIHITPSTVSMSSQSGNFCRSYLAEVIVNGQLTRENHTACRQPDGSWIEG